MSTAFDWIALLSMIGTLVGAGAACAAIYIASKIAKTQNDIQKFIHEETKLQNRRQLIVPIWDYCKALSYIDPKRPSEPDLVRSLNALELLGVCREGGMVDADVIDLVFKDVVLEIGKQILAVAHVETYSKTGQEMFEGSKAAYRMYLDFKNERINEGKLKKA